MSEEKQTNTDEHAWESGWEDHERQQLRRLAKLSLAEKLVWLEEAHRLVRNLQKAGGRNDPPNSPESASP